ncbi:terpenoid synthase [Meira miltonrushii]|uniref:(2E,6E)-farnesyl diphosphate synthase n=1 Tax=Meira miltonrushii TaxID=1280837 RepID=A0A316VCW1_9BASI|nr:terpenoid synthase [Meira miltonrushii]PWN35497.1 terpenoid synthase [Meira miltonrushii]
MASSSLIRGSKTTLTNPSIRRSVLRHRVFTPSISSTCHQRYQGTWSSVVGTAKSLLGSQDPPPPSSSKSSNNNTSSSQPPKPIIRDPLELVGRELTSLRSNVSSLLGSGHPSLDTIAKYYFQAEGKHVRPLMVLLMARATNGHSPLWPELLARSRAQSQPTAEAVENEMGINEPLSPKDVLNDFNPHMEGMEGKLPEMPATGDAATEEMRRLATEGGDANILPTQRRLAEITEMIHVASLLHDDVIDNSEMRRGTASAPSAFGNKLSILGGDFLLARASVALARLRNCEVVELLATVIANLVEGEVMQLQAQSSNSHPSAHKSAFTSFWNSPAEQEAREKAAEANAVNANGPSAAMFEHYLQKTYLKTAALIGKSTRAATILGGFGEDAIRASGCGSEAELMAKNVRDAAYTFGRNVGIAFQLVDDLLDFRSTSAAFGKPSGGADLRLGLATAPVLFAWQEYPQEQLGEMVKRKFSQEGDVEYALNIVRKSKGLERTTELAKHHAQLASDALAQLPQSEARDALEQLNEQIISRVK